MSIPSQLPNIALVPKAGGVQALSLRPQQVVQAVVLGPSADGGTQVQIGRQTLNLTLPVQPPAGTGLTLQAQGSGAEQRLVLLQQLPPTPQSDAALASTPSASTSSSPSSSAPTQQNQIQQLGLRPDQMVSGTVIGMGDKGASQVQVGRQVFNMVLPTPVPPGTVLTLQAQGSGSEQRLLIVQQSMAAAQTTPTPQTGNAAMLPEIQYVAVARALLTQMVQGAVSRQDTMAGLARTLAANLGNVPLPEAVASAGRRLLALQMPLGVGAPSGVDLQKSVLASGLFQEALLAAGNAAGTGGDVKSALLALRQALVSWIGPSLVPPQAGRAAPPLRGTFGRLTPPEAIEPGSDSSPDTVGRKLLDQTDSALARLRLNQHTSLPDIQARGGAEWSMDLPIIIGPHQTVMQFQIHRDGGNEPVQSAERGWQMRFAIDMPMLGEVGAQVGLRAGMTSVMLWAIDPETAAAIDRHLPELTEALVDAGLVPASVHCRRGEPPAAPVASGHFMDKLT